MSHFSTPDALLRELSRRGVALEIQGQKLKFQARKGTSAVTDLFPDLQRHKVALIRLLQFAQEHLEKDNPRALLVRWRARGVWLELEEVEVAGSWWLAVTYVVPHHLWNNAVKGELERDGPQLRLALEAEMRE